MRRISRVKRSGIADRVLQIVLALTVTITVIVNLLYLSNLALSDSKKLDVPSNELDGGEDPEGKPNLDLQVQKPGVDALIPASLVAGRRILITAHSGRDYVYLSIDDALVYEKKASKRGLHIVVLNQHSGRLMTSRVYDTFAGSYDKDIVEFLSAVSNGRLVVFLTLDEASNKLGQSAKDAIASYGSTHIKKIDIRDTWVLITRKGGKPLVEKFNLPNRYEDSWPMPATAQVYFDLLPGTSVCNFGTREDAERRRKFCSNYDGYGRICNCTNPEVIDFKPQHLAGNNITDVPIVIVAAERPFYLYQMLKRFLGVQGLNREMVTVFIDCEDCEEPKALCEVYNLKFVLHSFDCQKACRISNHYRTSIKETFDTHPDAKAMLILEEDLLVSPDILDYFSQTFPLLVSDPSLFCVSAWNDQGYSHAIKDPAQLYRVSAMPGLGWILKRTIFEELQHKWPKPGDPLADSDWDVWMRLDENLKGRACIVPEISRTYHFGAKGVNMNEYFHEVLFAKRPLNNVTGIKFNVERLEKPAYDAEMHKLVRNAIPLDHSMNQCTHKKQFIPDTEGKSYVAYIKMEKSVEDEENLVTLLFKPKQFETWLNLAPCFDLWYLSARGFYNGIIQFWYKKNRVYIVGFPVSPFSANKPLHIKPIFIAKEPKTN